MTDLNSPTTSQAMDRDLAIARVKRSRERWRTATAVFGVLAAVVAAGGATWVHLLTGDRNVANTAAVAFSSSATAAAKSARVQASAAVEESRRADSAASAAAIQSERADAAILAEQSANAAIVAQPSATPQDTNGVVWRPPTILAFNATSPGADLDSAPSDHQFARYSTSGDVVADVGSWQGSSFGLSVGDSSQAVFLGQQTGSYDVCTTNNDYSSENLTVSELVAQSWFCVRTSEGRIAVFEVIDSSAQKLDTLVTVYNGPTS